MNEGYMFVTKNKPLMSNILNLSHSKKNSDKTLRVIEPLDATVKRIFRMQWNAKYKLRVPE